MNKKQIVLRIEPPIDKPAVYKALARLEKEEWIRFTRIEGGDARGVNSEITQDGLRELLNHYSRGRTASWLRTKIFDLIDKTPRLRADPDWVATVQSLLPLIQKLTTKILPSGSALSTASQASNADVNEEYVLSIIWEGPQEALRKLIGWIEVSLLMERTGMQVRAPDEAFRELQTILKRHPIYLKLAKEVMKREIARYARILKIKKAMKNFVTTS